MATGRPATGPRRDYDDRPVRAPPGGRPGYGPRPGGPPGRRPFPGPPGGGGPGRSPVPPAARGGRPYGRPPFEPRYGGPPRPSALPSPEALGPDEELVAGRRPVEEAFVARRPAIRLLVVPQRRAALEKLVLHATNLRIPIVEVEGGSLTALAGFDGHQGVALVVEPRQFASLDDVLARAAERGEPPFILVLDSLEDPHNVGTLLRSAEAAGVHGVLFPTHRQAPLSPSAVKASAGAIEHLLLCPVDDLPGALSDLHARGVRIAGAEGDAPMTARQSDLRGPLAIVVGSEGQGLGPAVRRRATCSCGSRWRGGRVAQRRRGGLHPAVRGARPARSERDAERRRAQPAASRLPQPPAEGPASGASHGAAARRRHATAAMEAEPPADAPAEARPKPAAPDAQGSLDRSPSDGRPRASQRAEARPRRRQAAAGAQGPSTRARGRPTARPTRAAAADHASKRQPTRRTRKPATTNPPDPSTDGRHGIDRGGRSPRTAPTKRSSRAR